MPRCRCGHETTEGAACHDCSGQSASYQRPACIVCGEPGEYLCGACREAAPATAVMLDEAMEDGDACD